VSWGRRLREGEQPSKKKPSPRGRTGRGASGACVVGVRGRDAGGRARGAGSLHRRRVGAGAGGRVWAGAGPAVGPVAETLGVEQPDGVGGRIQRPD